MKSETRAKVHVQQLFRRPGNEKS